MGQGHEDISVTPAEFYRPPSEVMRLARMGAAHPTRLSFLRVLLRRMRRGDWHFDRPIWEVDAKGVGRAVYRARCGDRCYSLVAFAHDLPDHMRSDRVIATAWDATFTLFDGDPSEADLTRLAQNVPYQEAGRVSERELSLSRANRSVRLFSYVCDKLAQGEQPDIAEIDAVGYLMRTTAVYGSGKFGAADRAQIAERRELRVPFQAEMLTVWLIRQFTVDIVEHLAALRGGAKAVRLDPKIKERLGVGNSTGLGMAPFLIRHPVLINNWMQTREEALAQVRARSRVSDEMIKILRQTCQAAIANAACWHTRHPLQTKRLADLRHDLQLINEQVQAFPTVQTLPWDALWRWGAANLTLEGQEALISILLEPHGDLIDALAECMSADERAAFHLDGAMRIDTLRMILERSYDWALRVDFDQAEENARFWYVSEEKLEPRIGVRCEDEGAEREQPLAIARMAYDLCHALEDWPDDWPVARFLLRHPEHRNMVRRAQIAARYPYGEVQDNLIHKDVLPIDLMRCKLAFFGASHFDPRSDKWVRISLFQGAPYPLDL